MKAEHRKELERNVLAAWLGRGVEVAKARSKNAYAIGGVAVVLAVLVGGGWYLYHSRSASSSALWLKFDGVTSIEDLAKLASDNKGTIVAQAARFEEARAFLAQGVQNLASPPPEHDKALESLVKARDAYDGLIAQSKDIPTLQQEAMMGVATAEESLVDSGKDASLDKAQQYYERLAEAYKDTFQGKAARKRADELKDPKTRADIEKFYRNLNQRINKGG